MSTKEDRESIELYQKNLDSEIEGVAIYRLLTELEDDEDRRSIFEELAVAEQRHADTWRAKLREVGVVPRERNTSLKVRLVGLLARRFGVMAVLPIVRSMEAGAYQAYMGQGETAQSLAPEEREHGRALARMGLAKDSVATIVTRETWHHTGGGGALRASVFGLSDGLVSNTALVMGFAGARVGSEFVLLAGVAGLLAGAFSMAAGEYVSMRGQRELFERQIELEREEFKTSPGEEREELELIYRAKGLSADEAQATTDRLMENPEVALDTMVREELGLDPSKLGSPWGAAIGSFVSFAFGAIVPVVPFFLGANAITVIVIISATISAAALFLVGASLSLFTGRSAIFSGARQLALGSVAAALTYGIGRLIGVTTGV